MSKTSLRKVLKDFDAADMRSLLLDVYSKSKEAKEILDFFACPDIEKKTEEYKSILKKETLRYTRRAFRPRLPRLRSTIKRFRLLEPGNEAVAELYVYTFSLLVGLGAEDWLRDQLYDNITKFFGETLDFLSENGLIDDYLSRLNKISGSIKPIGQSINPLKRIVESEMAKRVSQF